MRQFRVEDAVRFLLEEGSAESTVESFGELRLPKGCEEAALCGAILRILTDYTKREASSRPFSLAVFGPPGSGKSFTVRALATQAGDIDVPEEINMSQFHDPNELTARLAQLFSSSGTTKTRLVFFDEFDCTLQREPLGWLRWFLAPMQDGAFIYQGSKISVGKAIFVFAGGTVPRYQDFQERHATYFVQAKGPDFVSRLRGILDIGGLNENTADRILRRALVLKHQLCRRSRNLTTEQGTLKIDKELLQSFLTVGRYKHGARSLEALLDMSTLTAAAHFDRACLPPAQMIALHVDRGFMDGFTIGIAAGGEMVREFHDTLAKTLLEQGAALAYGGDMRTEGILAWLIQEEHRRPPDLVPASRKRIQSFLAYPIFNEPGNTDRRQEDRVAFHEMHTLSNAELRLLKRTASDWFSVWEEPFKIEYHLAWALSLFRMRLRLAQEIDALVVVGGRETKNSGRYPGVAEEVMLALAFGVPVYIIGMCQGAARALGNLMGLSHTHQGIPESLCEQSHADYHPDYTSFKAHLAKWSASFDVPHKPGLPTTFDTLRQFLIQHAPGNPGWPYNGLTLRENMELFNTNEAERCIALVLQGFSRLKWEG